VLGESVASDNARGNPLAEDRASSAFAGFLPNILGYGLARRWASRSGAVSRSAAANDDQDCRELSQQLVSVAIRFRRKHLPIEHPKEKLAVKHAPLWRVHAQA